MTIVGKWFLLAFDCLQWTEDFLQRHSSIQVLTLFPRLCSPSVAYAFKQKSKACQKPLGTSCSYSTTLYTHTYIYISYNIYHISKHLYILHCLRSVLLTHPFWASEPAHRMYTVHHVAYLKALPVKRSPATTMPNVTPNKACAAGGLVYDWIPREGRDATKKEDALAPWTAAGFQSSPERVL